MKEELRTQEKLVQKEFLNNLAPAIIAQNNYTIAKDQAKIEIKTKLAEYYGAILDDFLAADEEEAE